jgi:hypothetical protein
VAGEGDGVRESLKFKPLSETVLTAFVLTFLSLLLYLVLTDVSSFFCEKSSLILLSFL